MTGSAQTTRIELSQIALAVYWACLVALFLHLRAAPIDVMINIDESIPLKLSEMMTARGVLDPNWRFADLHADLTYDQYNFYFYNIVAHWIITATKGFEVPALVALRHANSIFQLLALALSLDALRRIGADGLTLAVSGALIAVAPGMVQDAAMARPESLVYLLTALLIWLLTLRFADHWRALLAGAVLGAGMAVKLTFVSLAVLVAASWFRSPRPRATTIAAGAGLLALGVAVGFLLAAPYAVLHPDVYLNGIAALAQQYRTAHPPHSLPVYSIATQALWIGRYFFELYGVVPLVALAAPFLVNKTMRVWTACFVAAWFVLALYFVTSPVFFERNFSHGLIPLLLAAGLGVGALKGNLLRSLGAALLVAPMLYWSLQIAEVTRDRKRLERFEAAHALQPTERIFFGPIYGSKIPTQCETIAVYTANDPWSSSYLAKLMQQGFEPIAVHHGSFRLLVTSTLHTYLDSNVHYFRCP